jgi:hypothetical protein
VIILVVEQAGFASAVLRIEDNKIPFVSCEAIQGIGWWKSRVICQQPERRQLSRQK